jgi:acyl dehydratase|tara:strand:+ start:3397 stop:3861 length:465 start_codon:yes stop_codon:yes gene_type:complete
MGSKVVATSEMVNQIGYKFEPGDWMTLDQGRINSFADCTEDHQFIHVDEEAAAQTPFGGTIAHGLLTLSSLVKLCEDSCLYPENIVMGINYGFNKVRFLAPVRAGKRVRAHVEIQNVEPKDEKRYVVTLAITVEIEDEEKPALVAEWMNMMVAA